MNTNDINNLLDKIKEIDNTNLSESEIEELRKLENKLKDFVNIESDINLLNLDENIKKELTKTIKNSQNNKKYGLVWENQDENKLEELKVSYPILKKQSEIKNDNVNPTNILIEGDNLHALYMLTYTHKEKIDIITIDPPYNTKNKDFCYNDKFIGEDDEYRHSKWLSFMKPRLELAKELLKVNGIIFISIDNNELCQLKLLCDEIFGEQNLISIMPRKTVTHIRKISDSELQNIHDYILVYAKNKKNVVLTKEFSGEIGYPHNDKKGNYRLKAFQNSGANGTREARPNLYYPIYYDENKQILSLERMPNSIEILPKMIKNKDGRWLWSKEKFIKDNHILTVYKGTIYKKEYEWEIEDKGKYQAFKSWLDNYLNKNGTLLLNELDLGDKFSYPKPIELIKFFIKLSNKKDLVVLDFFAGSGTTGHAVLKLNEEDNGNRRFILCTNNENNICMDVTYPRLEKVINGYTNSKGKEIEGLGGNLKYYKIEMEEKKETKTQNIENLVDKLNPIISIAENCFNGHKQKKGKYILFKNDEETKIVGVCTTPWSSASLKEEIINELKGSGIEEKIMYINAENLDVKTSLDDREDWNGITFKSIPTELLSNYTLNDYIIDNID